MECISTKCGCFKIRFYHHAVAGGKPVQDLEATHRRVWLHVIVAVTNGWHGCAVGHAQGIHAI